MLLGLILSTIRMLCLGECRGGGCLLIPRLPREQYIEKIQQANTWGGAIELSIFAQQ